MSNILQRLRQNLQMRLSRILLPVTTRRIVHERINGYDLLVLANEDVGRWIHYGGCYEVFETEYLRTAICPDSVCIDVGANIGYFTMLMAQGAYAGSVHAFEPIALNVSLLKTSIELNGYKNVHVNQCAVGDIEGHVSFSLSYDSAYSSIHHTERKPIERTLTVPVTTIDDYVGRNCLERVDVLKADVEGAEGLVVAGSSRLLGDDKRKPKVVLLELYDQHLRLFGSSVDAVVSEMGGFGYKAFIVNEKGNMVLFSKDLKTRYYNVLFIPFRGTDVQ